jgi:hypothetical protein
MKDSLNKKYIDEFIRLWKESGQETPAFAGNKYSNNDRLKREKNLDDFLKKIKKNQNKSSASLKSNSSSPVITSSEIRNLFKSTFDYEESHLDIIFSDDYMNSTGEFIERARSFDSSLDTEDIFQACRNAWIINGIQSMMGIPVRLTPSSFAYSMLYPYTDNYLDDPSIPAEEKTFFSHRFRRRINGENIKPEDNHEKKIFELIEIIEDQYDRTYYPGVYRSLLAIHSSQTESIRLLDASNLSGEEDVLKICIKKGGTSVVADGYLVSGSLTEAQERFLFNYGAYLQLADDIQDTTGDLEAGLLTLFSYACTKKPLDGLTNRTVNTGTKIMEQIGCFGGSNLISLKSLMEKSIKMLIIESIGLNDRFYSRSYTRDIERYSPLRFSYLKKNGNNFSPGQDLFMEIMGGSLTPDS